MLKRLPLILTISSALVFSHTGLAVTVHKWKDANGVTHFSDEPAPQDMVSETLEYEGLANRESKSEDDFYSIANQWQRLKAERDATLARREAKAQRRTAERQAAYELQVAREANQQPSHPVVFGPVGRRGYWGGPLGFGHRGLGFGARSAFGERLGFRHTDRNAHRNARSSRHAPFHNQMQPQSVRPKSFSNRRSAYRARGSGGHAGVFVRF